jgi:hypothetical protein
LNYKGSIHSDGARCNKDHVTHVVHCTASVFLHGEGVVLNAMPIDQVQCAAWLAVKALDGLRSFACTACIRCCLGS